MPFPVHIDILNMILKGMIVGIIASAPMGPVGILCVQRTLNKGRWYGFVTGIGAAFSDLIYALITGFGMSFVMNFIQKPQTNFILQISASVILMLFGFYCWRNNPTKNIHKSGSNKGSYIYNGVTAFWITFLNPLIVFIFITAYAQLSFVIPNHPFEMGLGYLSILGGALLWWFGLTWLVDKIRGKFDTNGIIIINKVIGCIVIVFSLVVLIGTVFNLYALHW
ncbi:MAG: LysE family transporter [Prevotella sp.]|nr:LysE family transporter [Prevotella sp.]